MAPRARGTGRMTTPEDRERERIKKERQRQGYKCRPIVLHDATHIPALVAMGFLAEAKMEDDAAINEAYGAIIRHYCHMLRVSKGQRQETIHWACEERWNEPAELKAARERKRRHKRRLE